MRFVQKRRNHVSSSSQACEYCADLRAVEAAPHCPGIRVRTRASPPGRGPAAGGEALPAWITPQLTQLCARSAGWR